MGECDDGEGGSGPFTEGDKATSEFDDRRESVADSIGDEAHEIVGTDKVPPL